MFVSFFTYTNMKYFAAVLVVFISLFGYYFIQHQDADFNLLFYEKFGSEPCSVLAGKVVWITGASSGIGEYLAYELAKCGCKLVLSARRKHELDRVKEACTGIVIKKYPSFDKDKDILVLPLDLTKFSTHKELTSHVIQHYGKIDILVNNGGVGQLFSVEENPFEVEKNLLDINLLGTISLTKAVLPHMLKRKQGKIVVVSSMFGKYAFVKVAAYSASKHALQGYFNSLRLETSSRNVTVLTVLTGPVKTNVGGNALTNIVNVTLKEMPNYDPEILKWFYELTFMTPQRHSYLMTVAMANDLREMWPSTQPFLTYAYMSQYMPSVFMWYSEKKLAS